MIKLTKRTEYGLIALIHLAERDGQVISSREIGDTYPMPKRVLEEVLKDLQHSGLVTSTRGAHGGYTLAEPVGEISLGRVVNLLEGAPAITDCQAHEGDTSCEVHSNCPIRDPLERVKSGIWNLMEQTSLLSLMERAPLVSLGADSPVPTAKTDNTHNDSTNSDKLAVKKVN